jgi:UDPglucose--hexose-1-phosphate uridylyltransferase
MLQLNEHPHKRLNLLTGEWVLVSPHRNKRPWQGKVEALPPATRPAYDPACYLCPRNRRADGDMNPDYSDVFVFTNDFSALLPDTPSGEMNVDGLLQAKSEKGICRVISFSPRHDLTLAEMKSSEIKKVIDLWQKEFAALAQDKDLHYIQIFENKGEIMGCSNPHPHGQIWASGGIPVEIEKETRQQEQYFKSHGRSLLSDYLQLELAQKERIVADNEHFTVLVPFWAVWPFEAMIISKRHMQDITQFRDEEKDSLSDIMRQLLVRYDNLFETSFPYSAGMHQRPVNGGTHEAWHWHMHFYPPLLRSATVKKFMVGYEMLGNPQRDVTAEWAAERLRNLPGVHYKHAASVQQS